MMEKLILADDHQELEFNIDPKELKDIPFFQGYLSNHFIKDTIHVPNVMAAISSFMEHSTGFKFIHQKLICDDYFGIKPNLDILIGIRVNPEEFELLLRLVDYFGYDPKLVQAIYQNLPSNYELPDSLAMLLKKNYSKWLIYFRDYDRHLIYDINTREYIHDFNDEYLSQHVKEIKYDQRILLISQNAIVLHESQFIYAIDLKTNKIAYRVESDDIYKFKLSHDKKLLLIIHAEYITLYHADYGQFFKKIMLLGDFIKLSHDSKRILFVQDNTFKMIDIESEKIIKELELPYSIKGMKLSYDDKLLAIHEKKYPHGVRIIELNTGNEILSTEAANTYNFSTDSKKILIDKLIFKIYDIYTKEVVLTMYEYGRRFPHFISSKQFIFVHNEDIYLYDVDQKTQKLLTTCRKGIIRIRQIPHSKFE